MSSIRGATSRDVEAILNLGLLMHGESRYSVFPFDEDIARSLIQSFVADGVTRCCILSEAEGKTTGMIAGEVAPLMFSRTRVASDTIFYVLPERRGRFDGVRLLRAFESWALAQGAVEITLATSSGISVARNDTLLERFGYRQIGTVRNKAFKKSNP